MLWRFSRLKSLSLMETSTATTCLPSPGSTALSQVCDSSEPSSAGYFIFACWEALNLRQISSFILFATAVLRAVCGLAQLFAESAPFQIDNFSYFFSKAASRVSPLGYVLSQKQVAHGDRFREKCLKFIREKDDGIVIYVPHHHVTRQDRQVACACWTPQHAFGLTHTHSHTRSILDTPASRLKTITVFLYRMVFRDSCQTSATHPYNLHPWEVNAFIKSKT